MHESLTAELDNLDFSDNKPKKEKRLFGIITGDISIRKILGRVMGETVQAAVDIARVTVPERYRPFVKGSVLRMRAGLRVITGGVSETAKSIIFATRSNPIKTLLVCPGQMDTVMFGDVATPSRVFAPVLNSKEVARSVVSRVEKAQDGALYMPLYANFIPLLKGFPVRVVKLARWWSGVDGAVMYHTNDLNIEEPFSNIPSQLSDPSSQNQQPEVQGSSSLLESTPIIILEATEATEGTEAVEVTGVTEATLPKAPKTPTIVTISTSPDEAEIITI